MSYKLDMSKANSRQAFDELCKELLEARCKHDRDARESRVRLALLAHTGLLMAKIRHDYQPSMPPNVYTLSTIGGATNGRYWHIDDIERALGKIGVAANKR